MLARSTLAVTTAFAAAALVAGCASPRVTPTPVVTLPASPTATATVDASPSPYATYTPSPTPSATPSPTAPEGPITSVPDGEPVEPEIFLASYSPADEELSVVVFVRDVYETGGTCTVTVTAGTRSYSQERVGEADATGTACGQFRFDVSDVTNSSVDVVAYYTSNGHEGMSNTVKVEIS